MAGSTDQLAGGQLSLRLGPRLIVILWSSGVRAWGAVWGLGFRFTFGFDGCCPGFGGSSKQTAQSVLMLDGLKRGYSAEARVRSYCCKSQTAIIPDVLSTCLHTLVWTSTCCCQRYSSACREITAKNNLQFFWYADQILAIGGAGTQLKACPDIRILLHRLNFKRPGTQI